MARWRWIPAWPPTEAEAQSSVAEALGASVEWTGATKNGFFLLALLADEHAVGDLRPDLAAVKELEAAAVIVTAAADTGQRYDFVTGSSHTVLAPFWAGRLGRTSLVAFQASERSG